ncbi:MAG: hypothetical protein IKN24_07345 [Lachnospiraceae bacterium]|nr:hypothetical protein [Lachnospiraceae bacterium]
MVNDGLRDGSAEICDMLARDHKNIRVIHKENGGGGFLRVPFSDHGSVTTFLEKRFI